ncbi:MAG: formyltransferase family protein [Candidatus Cloacimonadaceae bacterium]
MKIVLISMNDPMYTIPFMKDVLNHFKYEISLVVTVTKGDRMTLSKGKSKLEYLFSLLLIMGIYEFIKSGIIQIVFKLKVKLSRRFAFIESPELSAYAQKIGIKSLTITNPNAKSFLEQLAAIEPDIIVNQSQAILKKAILSIPKIGVLNRHNALLPKNRGRLTPFWVVYNRENETGVSIHLMNEDLDAGPIVVQKRYEVKSGDTFNEIVRKNYQIASNAMIEAIELIKNGFSDFMDNNNEEATYNSTPSLKEAFQYRKILIGRLFKKK